MTIEKNNWNRWKKTAGSFDMEEIQMALRNYNTREENEMQEQKQLQDLEKEMEKYPQIQSLAEARLLLSKERRLRKALLQRRMLL